MRLAQDLQGLRDSSYGFAVRAINETSAIVVGWLWARQGKS
jgi:hypothetical protein